MLLIGWTSGQILSAVAGGWLQMEFELISSSFSLTSNVSKEPTCL